MTGILCAMVGAKPVVVAVATAFTNDSNTDLLVHFDGADASTTFTDDNAGAAGGQTAVSFDGTDDFYETDPISTTATDGKKLTFACTFYWNSATNLQHIANVRLGTGATDYGFWVWVNGGRMQCKMVSGSGSVPTSIYETNENSLTSDAYNNVVIYWDTDSYTTNTKIYVNGVSKAISNEGTPANTWNWGTSSGGKVKIGEANSSQTGDGADFTGRIAQLYIHNGSTAPTISDFYSNGPRDLGTNGTATGLAQPLIYHYGGTSTFTTNNGTGFNSYTLSANGSIATATGPSYVTRAQITLTAQGNAQVDTAQYKFSTGSGLFDGTGDYITTTYTPTIVATTGSATMECYVRASSWSGVYGIANQSLNGWQYGFTWLTIDGVVYVYWRGGGASYIMTSTTTLSTNTWHHLAVVNDNGTGRLYVNGVQEDSDATWGDGYSGSTTLEIGRGRGNGSGLFDNTIYYMNGWIDEFRCGPTARYPNGTTFTPGV